MKLSVVIPTLNEAACLPRTVHAVRERAMDPAVLEIIVADSGSTDATVARARSLGVKVVEWTGGAVTRSQASNRGAAVARGQVIQFVDADSVPPPGYDGMLREVLANRDVVGGAFEFAFEPHNAPLSWWRSWGLRMVTLVNRLRYRVWPRYYGDQGLFVRADVFREVGGFPSRAILETSDLCASLNGKGRLVLIRAPMLTSPRRFVEEGVYRVFANDFRVWFLDHFGFETEHFGSPYRRNNFRRGCTDRQWG